MQGFAAPLRAIDPFTSLRPEAALAVLPVDLPLFGNGVRFLTALDAARTVTDLLPEAAKAVLLPAAFANLPPVPIYGRAPDAKPAVPKPPVSKSAVSKPLAPRTGTPGPTA